MFIVLPRCFRVTFEWLFRSCPLPAGATRVSPLLLCEVGGIMSARLFQLLSTAARADSCPEHYARLRCDFSGFRNGMSWLATPRPSASHRSSTATPRQPPRNAPCLLSSVPRLSPTAYPRRPLSGRRRSRKCSSVCAGEALHPVLLKGAAAAILAYPQAALRPIAISTCSPAAPTLPASRRYFPACATAPYCLNASTIIPSTCLKPSGASTVFLSPSMSTTASSTCARRAVCIHRRCWT